MFLYKKLKEARNENNLTQKQLANQLTELGRKTSNTVIANWESGLNSPDVDTLQLICSILKKDTNYFFDLSESIINSEPNQYVLDLYNSLSPNNQLETVRYMRFLKTSNNSIEPKIQILGQTAAGKPIEYGDSYAQDIEDISNIPDNADYALVVNGDSMEPLIRNKQLIYVKQCLDVENGTIAVVEIDGAVTCKKVYKWADHIELQSLNTAYEPIIITAGNFKILGKVLLE